MYVCVCNAVTDGDIRRSVDEGATCLRDLSTGLEVGRCCGVCVPVARAVLDRALQSALERIGCAA